MPEDKGESLGIGVVPMGLVVGGMAYADGQLDSDDLLGRSVSEPSSVSAYASIASMSTLRRRE